MGTETLLSGAQGCRGELHCCLTPAGTQLREGRLLPERQDLGAGQMRLLTDCSVTVRRAWLQNKVIYLSPPWHCLHCFHCMERWGWKPSNVTRRDAAVRGCWNVVSARLSHSAQSILHPAHLLLPSCRNIQAKSMKHCSSLFSIWKSVFSSWRNSWYREGNDLKRSFIFYTVCLIFLNQLFSGGHIFQNVTESSLGLLRFKDGPRPLNVLPKQTQQDSHLLLFWLPVPLFPES